MPSSEKPALSVLILAKNEGDRIRECIASAQFAREVVVVDSGSTDGTRDIARGSGARVMETPWPGDFSMQRNRAEAFAACDWVLQLDADEVVTPELAGEIRAYFRSGLHATLPCARMPRKEIIFGKWVRHGGWYPQYKLRMYRKGAGSWTGRVHERYDSPGPVHTFANPIVHDSYRDIPLFVEKFNRYSTIDAEEDFAAGRKFRLHKLFLVPAERFLGRYVRHRGYRDGFHGFALAALIGLNYFLRHLKLWELHYRRRRSDG
jgi:glycosyltransferase involved in cell wall biosynthesis